MPIKTCCEGLFGYMVIIKIIDYFLINYSLISFISVEVDAAHVGGGLAPDCGLSVSDVLTDTPQSGASPLPQRSVLDLQKSDQIT
ncbi:hypothetical protein [Pseudomonas sp. NIBRBAC000502773]|uniref:hypothetical protein n=1 Tax=Pseudomonas sp. NIBRBAC000502773 TaxID=2590776 RepID=UPI0011308227|nr:hypothetical protein [Pseudomonas sp. NIBRBAC000502773]QDG55403.1 hypothetical protein NIBR502773_02275 [Pseudomonas sp. NIBRBAC000502773]